MAIIAFPISVITPSSVSSTRLTEPPTQSPPNDLALPKLIQRSKETRSRTRSSVGIWWQMRRQDRTEGLNRRELDAKKRSIHERRPPVKARISFWSPSTFLCYHGRSRLATVPELQLREEGNSDVNLRLFSSAIVLWIQLCLRHCPNSNACGDASISEAECIPRFTSIEVIRLSIKAGSWWTWIQWMHTHPKWYRQAWLSTSMGLY